MGAVAVPPLAIAQPVTPLAYVQTVGQPGLQAVQQRLHDLGIYAGAADGVWGHDSQSALLRYQQNQGLQVTGHLNPGTLGALGLSPAVILGFPTAPVAVAPTAVAPAVVTPPVVASATPPNAVVSVGADTIRTVQGRLQQLGYVSTPADGVWGPSTQEGITRLQQARGLPVSGQLNAPTMSAMGLDPGVLVQGH